MLLSREERKLIYDLLLSDNNARRADNISKIKMGVIALILALFTLSYWIAWVGWLCDLRNAALDVVKDLSFLIALLAVIFGAYAWRKSNDKFGLLGLGLVVLFVLGYFILLLFVLIFPPPGW